MEGREICHSKDGHFVIAKNGPRVTLVLRDLIKLIESRFDVQPDIDSAIAPDGTKAETVMIGWIVRRGESLQDYQVQAASAIGSGFLEAFRVKTSRCFYWRERPNFSIEDHPDGSSTVHLWMRVAIQGLTDEERAIIGAIKKEPTTIGSLPTANEPRVINVDESSGPLNFHIDKRTHRLRIMNETESSVDIVIEQKDSR